MTNVTKITDPIEGEKVLADFFGSPKPLAAVDAGSTIDLVVGNERAKLTRADAQRLIVVLQGFVDGVAL